MKEIKQWASALIIYTTFYTLILINSNSMLVRNNSFGEQLNRKVNEFDSNLIRLRTTKL